VIGEVVALSGHAAIDLAELAETSAHAAG